MHCEHELFPTKMADNNTVSDSCGTVSGECRDEKSTREKKFHSIHSFGRGRKAKAIQLAAARSVKRGKAASLAAEERPSLTAPAVGDDHGEDSTNGAGLSRSELKIQMLASDTKRQNDFSGVFCNIVEKKNAAIAYFLR